MKKQKVVLQFICYAPRIYSGFDTFNVSVAQNILDNGYLPVFVFSDTLDFTPSIAEDLRSVGAKVELLHSANIIKQLKQVLDFYILYKPAITHTHFVDKIKILTAFFSYLFGIKHFTTFHSSIWLGSVDDFKQKKGVFKLYGLRLYYKLLVLFSTKIFTVSDDIKFQFLAFASSRSTKVQTIYLGVKQDRNTKSKTELRTLLGLPQDEVLLCNIAAFEPIKGIDILCKAIAVLKNKYQLKGFKVCHIGGLRSESKENRSYREYIYSLSNTLGVAIDIYWLGHRNDINDILSAFDIYVHPSRMEGLGLANMEAAVQALPLVGANVGGIPEIIHHEKNGYLFESEDEEELAFFLDALIQNVSLRETMGLASLAIAKSEFDIVMQSKKMVACYFTKNLSTKFNL